MKNLEKKSYSKPYKTGTAQKRKREALDKVKERRTSCHKAKLAAVQL